MDVDVEVGQVNKVSKMESSFILEWLATMASGWSVKALKRENMNSYLLRILQLCIERRTEQLSLFPRASCAGSRSHDHRKGEA